MSTLIQDILTPNLQINQTIRIERHINGAHIRPWIYVEGVLVDGDLKMTVLQGATELITKTINFAAINDATTDTFNHGFLRFDFDTLQLNVAEGPDASARTQPDAPRPEQHPAVAGLLPGRSQLRSQSSR